MKPDIYVDGDGSMAVLSPNTPTGKEWMETHMPKDAPRIGQGYAVEVNYASDILVGMVRDGLSLAQGIPPGKREADDGV